MDETRLAYSEVYTIVNLLGDEALNRIPEKVLNFFEEERDKEYIPVIDLNSSLVEQNIKRKTMVLLEILTINYWCDNEEEKQKYINKISQNTQNKIKKQKEIEEKYSVENLFKNKIEDNKISKENIQMVEYKKINFIQKLLRKIIKFFKR